MDTTLSLPAIVATLSEHGDALIPVRPNKKPAISTWRAYQNTPPSRSQLENWQQLHPPWGWARVTGAAYDLVVLDLDVGASPDTRTRLEAAGPPTFRTPSGGHHWCFHHPGGTLRTLNARTSRQLLPGLDVRADGGYHVLWCRTAGPDGTPGYFLTPGTPPGQRLDPARLDEQIRHLYLTPTASTTAPQPPTPIAHEPATVTSATCPARLLDHARDALARIPGRNNAAFHWLCQLRDNGIAEAEAFGLYSHFHALCPNTNQHGVIEPYTEREWRATLQQVYRNPARAPWAASLPTYHVSTRPCNYAESLNGAPHRPDATPPLPQTQTTLTDLGNAQRLAARHRHDLRWCELWDTWLLWDKTHWQRDETRRVEELAHQLVIDLYQNTPATPANLPLRRWALQSHGNRHIRAMLERARALPAFATHPDDWDRHPWLLNAQNGTIDLTTGELLKHDPDHRLTQIAGAPLDTEHTPATRWTRFLTEIMHDDAELVAHLHRWCGYILTGDDRERTLAIAHGTGKNGKSVLLETLLALLHDYATKLPRNALSTPPRALSGHEASPHLVPLRGKRFAYLSETDEHIRIDTALVKELTGRETLTVRDLYRRQFTFRPTHKLWISTNHRPHLPHDDAAIWDRVQIVPFLVRFDGADADLKLTERLATELPQILAWASQGTRLWLSQGLAPPSPVRHATNDYRADQDLLQQFLDDACHPAPDLSTSATAFYAALTRWCTLTHETAPSKRAVTPMMESKGYQLARSTGGRYHWRGITLNDEPHLPIEEHWNR